MVLFGQHSHNQLRIFPRLSSRNALDCTEGIGRSNAGPLGSHDNTSKHGNSMNRFFSYLLRFLLIASGYVVALVAACAFILALGWGSLFVAEPDPSEPISSFVIRLSLGFAVAFAGYFSFLPAMIFAVIAEVLGKRTWLFHAIGGMVVAAAALAVHLGTVRSNDMFMIVLAAGAVGGTVYWLIAGRSAGRTLDRAAETLPPTSG